MQGNENEEILETAPEAVEEVAGEVTEAPADEAPADEVSAENAETIDGGEEVVSEPVKEVETANGEVVGEQEEITE